MTNLEQFRDDFNAEYEQMAARKAPLEAAFPGLRTSAQWIGLQKNLEDIYSLTDDHVIDDGLATGLTPPAPVEPPVEPPIEEPPPEPVEPPPVVIDPPALIVRGRDVLTSGGMVMYSGNNALGEAVKRAPKRLDGKPTEIAIEGYCDNAWFKAGGNVNIRPLKGTQAEIRRNPVSGGDTLAFFPGVNGVHFYDLDIHLSDRALCITVERGATAPPTMGLGFHGCDSMGGYDHVAGSGPTSKWGFLLNMTGDVVIEQCVFQGIQKEHFLYGHNQRGDYDIRANHVERVGRTFCQFVNRPQESAYLGLPAGIGTIRIEDNDIEDAGCSHLDGGHGGSAITIAGRHSGQVIIARNKVRLGFQDALFAKLLPMSKPGQQPFNACAAIWDGGTTSNAYVLMDENDWDMADRAGIDATLICDGTALVEMRRNRIQAGKPGRAADFNRVGKVPCGSILLGSGPNANVFVGKVSKGGQPWEQP